MSAFVKELGNTVRQLGKSIDTIGVSLMGKSAHVEKLNISVRSVAHKGIKPTLVSSSFVAPDSTVVGDVVVGEGTSVWYNVILRGDKGSITIGENSNIQDRASVFAEKATTIGSNVTVGAGSTVTSCIIGDDCMVGAGAMVMDGAVIEARSIIAAGSVVAAGTKIGSGTLWAGSPATQLRELTADEIATIAETAAHASELATEYNAECFKSWQEIEQDAEDRKVLAELGEHFLSNPAVNEMPERPGEIFNQSEDATDVTFAQRKTMPLQEGRGTDIHRPHREGHGGNKEL